MYLLPAMPALRVYPPCPRPIMRMPLVCTEKASSTAKRWFYDWCGNLTIESTLRWCILRSPKSVESAVYGASCNAPSTLTVVVQPRNARGKHMQLTSGGRLTTYKRRSCPRCRKRRVPWSQESQDLASDFEGFPEPS